MIYACENLSIRESMVNYAESVKKTNPRKMFLSTRIVKDMAAMRAKFESTDMQYVRCIKTTNELRPGIFEENLVSQQIRDLGISANTRLCKNSYITHIPFHSFCHR